MALSQKAGSFAANTSTGNQAVTGVGFQPKALILMVGGLTADGNGAKGQLSFAFIVSSSQRECIALALDDGGTPSNTGVNWNSRAITELTDGTPTTGGLADMVSFDADGFTINWSVAPATALKVNYYALGGSAITNAAVGTWQVAGTGSRSKTGLGFQPDLVLFFGADAVTAHTSGSPALFSLGGFTNAGGSIQQGSTSLSFVDNGTANTDTRLYQRIDQAIVTESGGSKRLEANGVSMDSDGWTLNVGTCSVANILTGYLAIKGGSWKFGSLTTPTSTGDAATTGAGFTPTGILAFLGGLPASTAIQSNINLPFSVGFASAAAAARALGLGVNNTALTAKQNSADARLVAAITPAAAAYLNASLKTLDSDGFTLTWNTVQASGMELIYLVGGGAAADLPVADIAIFCQGG